MNLFRIVAPAVAVMLVIGGSAEAAVVAHWSFDVDPGGGAYSDDSGNGHNASQSGNPAHSTSSVFGPGALLLDGNDHLTAPGGANRINIDGGSFSLSFWTNRDTTGSDYVVGQGNSASARRSLHVGFRDNNTFTFAFWSDDLNYTNSVVTDTANYHHWVSTYDVATGTQRVYLDGNQVPVQTDSAGAFTSSGSHDFWIGRRRDGNNYAGLVDEVWVFDRVLQPWEVTGLYSANAAVPEPATLLVWSLLAGLGVGLGWRRRRRA